MNNKSIINEMKSYYDHRAQWHDEYMSYQGSEKMEEFYASIIKKLESIIVNKSVLEIACGTGNWTQVLASRAKYVTAVDTSKQSLTIANEKLKNIENISLINDDAYKLDSINSSYDIIIALDFFSHIPKSNINSFLTLLQNHTKQSSHIIFIDMLEKEYFQSEKSYIDIDGNRISTRVLPNGESFDVIKNFQPESEMCNILSEYSRSISYSKFDLLERWMIIYQPKQSKSIFIN